MAKVSQFNKDLTPRLTSASNKQLLGTSFSFPKNFRNAWQRVGERLKRGARLIPGTECEW
ncbi:unnamed protein product, partial [Amoebophrya sp. A25]